MKKNRHISKNFILISILVSACFVLRAGHSVQEIELLDLENRSVNAFDAGRARAVVFVLVRTDCPISNRYAPELERLRREYGSRDIEFRLVYPGSDESIASIKQHVKEYRYGYTVLRDPRHELVRMAGLSVTPQVAVYLRDGPGWKLVYRGRIDDRYVAFGKARPAPTRHDLRDVLDRILKSEKTEFIETPAIGCYIS